MDNEKLMWERISKTRQAENLISKIKNLDCEAEEEELKDLPIEELQDILIGLLEEDSKQAWKTASERYVQNEVLRKQITKLMGERA